MTNNLNILPFYSSVDKQHHRKDYAYGKVYPIIAATNSIPTCQIKFPRYESVYSISAIVKNLDGTKEYIADINWSWIYLTRTSEYSLLAFKQDNVFYGLPPADMREGQYYLELTLDVELAEAGRDILTFYSEVFTWVRDLSKYLKLQYWDNFDLPVFDYHIAYEWGYKNTIYLQTQLGKPEYPFEEEIIKRDGYEFPEKQLSEKRFRFTFLAPEFLIDALRIVRMHDNVYIRNIDGEVYRANSFLLNLSRWEEQGDLAALEVEFECDTIIKKVGTGILNS